jgi:hypothetical protein
MHALSHREFLLTFFVVYFHFLNIAMQKLPTIPLICILFLQILYVDSLETDAVDVPQGGIRCSVWTNKSIRCVADLDTDSSGSFGALPVCYP